MEHLHPPYKCGHCNFMPMEADEDSMCDEILMHIGCEEGAAIKLYKNKVAELQADESISATKKKQAALVCKICNAAHEQERLFLRHLTLRHFTKELCDELPKKLPYRCPYLDCNVEKTNLHGLMLHYGCEHNVSMELYHKRFPAFSPLPPASEMRKSTTAGDKSEISAPSKQITKDKAVPMSKATAAKTVQRIVCRYCKDKKTFITQKSLNYHILLFHFFSKVANLNLGPFPCSECSEKFTQKNFWAQHFISDHFESYIIKWEADQTGLVKDTATPEPSSVAESPDPPPLPKNTTSKRTLSFNAIERGNNALPSTPASEPRNKHLKLSKTGSSSTPSSDPFEAALNAANSLPAGQNVSKSRQTVHRVPGELSARQRMMNSWQNTSLDVQKQKIADLEEKIQQMEEEHKEKAKKQTEVFERWINQKESALEEESKAKKAVEEKLEQALADSGDLKKQLEQQQVSTKSLEEIVAEKHSLNLKVTKEKKALEKRIVKSEAQVEEMETEMKSKQTALEEMTTKLDQKETNIQELENTLAEKEEEIKDYSANAASELAESVKKQEKLEKQIEHHKTRAEKLMEDKKEKTQAMKDMAKKQKDTEKELKDKISQLEEQKKMSNSQNMEIKKELKKLEKDLNNGNEEKIKTLEIEVNSLNDSLEKTQRILNDFENIIQERNEKLKESNTRFEEVEMNLEDALQKLKDQKGLEKERKESAKQIKQLQSTLKNWEERQFTNLKLISGLQKENDDLKKKVKDFQENNTGAEEELYELSTNLKKSEKEAKNMQNRIDQAEQEKARIESRLQSKIEELSSLNEKNCSLENQVRDLEKQVRSKHSDHDEVQKLKTLLDNQDAELGHLKVFLTKTKELNAEKVTEIKNMREALHLAQSRNDKFENDYSQLIANHETLKNALKETHRKFVNYQKELSILRKKDADSNLAPALVAGSSVGNSRFVKMATSTHIKQEIIEDGFPNGEAPRNNILSPANKMFQIKEEPIDVEEEQELPEFHDIPDSSGELITTCQFDVTDGQLILSASALDSEELDSFEEEDDEDDLDDINSPDPLPPELVPKTPLSVIPASTFASVSRNPIPILPQTPVSPDVVNQQFQEFLSQKERKLSFYQTQTSKQTSAAVAANSPNTAVRTTLISPPKPSTSKIKSKQLNQLQPIAPISSAQSPQSSPPAKTSTVKPSGKKSKLPDVTGTVAEVDIVCGICKEYDPPLPEGGESEKGSKYYTTDWVGCDCDMWYHKQCTKLKRIKQRFSCRSVKRKCKPA